jgi:hypothetical protein
MQVNVTTNKHFYEYVGKQLPTVGEHPSSTLQPQPQDGAQQTPPTDGAQQTPPTDGAQQTLLPGSVQQTVPRVVHSNLPCPPQDLIDQVKAKGITN